MVEKTSEAFATLVLSTGILKKPQLEEAQKTATSLNVPVERAITMLDMLSYESLALVKEAQTYVDQGAITLDMAVRALRLARQQHMHLEDAIGVIGSVHKATAKVPTLTTPLTQLLLDCELINTASIGRALQQSHDTGMQTGRILVLNREVSSWVMTAALQALVLVREKKIDSDTAKTALKAVGTRKISIEQALFELGLYVPKGEQNLKIGELIAMSGLISEGDLIECVEIQLVKEKQFGQILLEQGLVTQDVLEAAIVLLDMMASGSMRGFQAAQSLKAARNQNISVYQAMAELSPPVQAPQREISFKELLVESLMVDPNSIDKIIGDESSAIKAGKRVLATKALDETLLFLALRTYALCKQGFLPADEGPRVLKYCGENGIGLDESLKALGWIIPARMQWVWS